MVPQLTHCRKLRNLFESLASGLLSHRLLQQEAGSLESLLRMLMIQLEDLVEGSFGNFTHILIDSPLVKRQALLVSLICSFEIVCEHQSCSQKFVLGCAVNIHPREVLLELFPFLCQLFELTIIGFQTFDVLFKCCLGLVHRLALVIRKLLSLVVKFDEWFPASKHFCLLHRIDSFQGSFREFGKSANSLLQLGQLSAKSVQKVCYWSAGYLLRHLSNIVESHFHDCPDFLCWAHQDWIVQNVGESFVGDRPNVSLLHTASSNSILPHIVVIQTISATNHITFCAHLLLVNQISHQVTILLLVLVGLLLVIVRGQFKDAPHVD